MAGVLLLGMWISQAAAETNLDDLASQYFNAWAATQAPDASKQSLENYLALLTDDVGHQHLPYDPDGSRDPEGKANMREGMQYYLGAHTTYQAQLVEQIIGYQVIVLVYDTEKSGVHPQTNETITSSYRTTEVLEVEGSQVSVIRKYSE